MNFKAWIYLERFRPAQVGTDSEYEDMLGPFLAGEWATFAEAVGGLRSLLDNEIDDGDLAATCAEIAAKTVCSECGCAQEAATVPGCCTVQGGGCLAELPCWREAS